MKNLTHYVIDRPKSSTPIFAFELGKCENCDGDVQEPNAIHLSKNAIRALRLKKYDGPAPHELGWCDELGAAVCMDCYSDATSDDGISALAIASDDAPVEDHGTCPRCGAEDVDLEDETCKGGCLSIDFTDDQIAAMKRSSSPEDEAQAAADASEILDADCMISDPSVNKIPVASVRAAIEACGVRPDRLLETGIRPESNGSPFINNAVLDVTYEIAGERKRCSLYPDGSIVLHPGGRRLEPKSSFERRVEAEREEILELCSTDSYRVGRFIAEIGKTTTPESDALIVRFYDLDSGQRIFTGASYSIQSFMYRGGGELDLHGGCDEWTLTAGEVAKVRYWLANRLEEIESSLKHEQEERDRQIAVELVVWSREAIAASDPFADVSEIRLLGHPDAEDALTDVLNSVWNQTGLEDVERTPAVARIVERAVRIANETVRLWDVAEEWDAIERSSS